MTVEVLKPANNHLNHGLPMNGVNGVTKIHINGAVPHVNGLNGTNGLAPMQANGNGDNSTFVHAADSTTGTRAQTPIAICGMALRLPGGLETPQQLWDFLLAKGDARSVVPESRYNISSYHSTSGRPGSVTTKYGYFLNDDVSLGAFDTSRFTLSRAELEGADPQLRRMLEVVRECFDDAGEVHFRGRNIGCYIGSYGEDWLEMQTKDPLQSGPYRVDGYSDFMLTNRVSYEMDIHGPSMTVRTACSSALTSLHEACLAIQHGDCEAAIVGGINLILAPAMTAFMSEKGVLSPEGSCKTFSSDADGYARGEGISAVYIKPLDAALRDGNPIRAVIRSTMANHDGKTQGITYPSTDSQEAMIRKAYQLAGISDFSQTAFVECHGTGTAVGDPIETNAVARVFGDAGVFIGSVKPNLGHSEGASGLTSLIKAVLSLENRTIPPNIKLSSPNPKIPFKERKLTVPLNPIPWPESRHERVSVNSFGIGGSNAHVILDSARSVSSSKSTSNGYATPAPDTAAKKQSSPSSQLLVFSASSGSSLKRMNQTFQDLVHSKCQGSLSTEYLQNLAYTLANKREHLPHRAFMVARSDGAGVVSPSKRIAGSRPNLVMVFTGQGAQWPRMGRELLLRSDLCFQSTIRSLDRHLRDAQAPSLPQWTLEEELLKPPRTSGVQIAELSQPLCTAVQIGLVNMFMAAGVEPQAVVGHSSGEIAAAYAAGALTEKEAIIVAWQRGLAVKKQTKPGAMAAIGLGLDEVRDLLSPNVTVACENSNKSITLSGDAPEVNDTILRIKKTHPEALTRLLKVDKAYHSHHMSEIGEEYSAVLQRNFIGRKPVKPFFSSVTGEIETIPLDGPYWQKNLESRVLFRTAVLEVLALIENPVFLELGPHSALAGPLRQISAEVSSSAPYVSTMSRGEDCTETFLSAVGKLFQLNVPIDFSTIVTGGHCLSDLPPYPWNYETEYWQESRISREWRNREFPSHPLLGVRQLESTSLEPSWRNLLIVDKDCSWLRDHTIENSMIFPCAGYLAMVGEAMRQLSRPHTGLTMRRIVISTALLLADTGSTELVTTFRPHRLTDSLQSQWWDFTISSFNGHSWVSHCTGQVMSEAGNPQTAKTDNIPLPRKLESARYYNFMDTAGLQFGPRFRRLENARCGTEQDSSTADLSSVTIGDEENYHLHPTAVDAVIQSAFFAALKGHPDTTLYRRVPTKIASLTMHQCESSGDMKILTSATLPNHGGDLVGQAQQVIQNGKIIFQMEGLRMSPLQAAEAADKDISQYPARLTWGPHLDFLDAKYLIQPSLPRDVYTPLLDELAQLCLVYTHRLIKDVPTPVPHMEKYQAWISTQVQSLSESIDPAIAASDDESITAKIHSLTQTMSDTPVAACAIAMQKVTTNISGLLSGQIEALDILLADNTLYEMYGSMDTCDRSEFIKHLAHTKPNLNILEIGAGTGASTVQILKDLTLPGATGFASYGNYTFTDISSGFFVSAKELLKGNNNIEFRTLDISKDPIEQDFSSDVKYDLVIATNVLYATKNLGESLRNVRKLLGPDGRLLLVDLFSTSKWPNFILGTLPSWWSGESDGRSDEPYVTPARWSSELTAAGFEQPAIVLDGEEPHQLSALIVAKAKADGTPAINGHNLKAVSLLCDDNSTRSLVDAVSQQLQDKGYTVHTVQLGEKLPDNQDVLCLLDYDRPFFEDIDETRYSAFQSLVGTLGSSRLLWAMRPCHIRCQNPRYAQSIGAARTIRSEMLLNVGTLEVDDMQSSLDRIVEVFERYQARNPDEILKPDFEYAISNGEVYVSRLYPFLLEEETALGSRDSENDQDQVVLHMANPGRLTSLTWQTSGPKKLRDHYVEVHIHASSLNFRDVLCALGVVPFPEEGLGLEASGVVCRVGLNVKNLQIGDRVMLLGNGSFATNITVDERHCQKIPDILTFEDAATMPAVFATAIYALFNLGHLQKGQSILIHSACGGVGLAAIQLARMAGAEIYVTVGSEDKVAYLTNELGFPKNRIFNSRDTSFVDGLMRETQNKGVDLVLNSLSGELLHATWHCVAEFGTMVEIGKRDLLGFGRLDMNVFLANRTYACLDLDQLREKRQDSCKELLRSIVEFYEKGDISPIRPIKSFDASEIQSAFRNMQQGQHIGKLVISIRDKDGCVMVSEANRVKTAKKLNLDNSASYLLVGGLGGLGRSVSRLLVENGARRLLFLSRSSGQSPDHAEFVREMESMGCEVVLIKGSVTNSEDVAYAVQQAGPSLRGILQCTMVLRDVGFMQMTIDDWHAASAPKVRGTWLLHEATIAADITLDFFLLFSSLSGTLGTPGQANYAGANTFLDAFVQYRTNLGLAAAAINIGAVMDVGAASLDDSLMQRMAQACALGIKELELLEYITAALSTFSSVREADQPAVTSNGSTAISRTKFFDRHTFITGLGTTMPLNNPDNRAFHRQDRRMALYHNTSDSSASQNDDGKSTNGLDAFLKRVRASTVEEGGALALLRTKETTSFLARQIGHKLFTILLRSDENLDTAVPLSQLGMDSLSSVEMRSWWRQALGFDITVMELLGMGNLDALGKHAAEGIAKMLGLGE